MEIIYDFNTTTRTNATYVSEFRWELCGIESGKNCLRKLQSLNAGERY